MRKFNLSLDDFSPHLKTGLNFESIDWCNKLIELYPKIKINLFVPAAYCRLKEEPIFLSHNIAWIDKVNALPENYRINMHGLYHRRVDGENPDSNNDEFQFLKGEWAENIVESMINEFDKSGLRYFKTFRPPGWKISCGAAQSLTNRGFIIAGNEPYRQLLSNSIQNMKWVSYNWDMTKECDVPETEDILVYGHTSIWTNNYMNEERFNLINNILSKEDFEFVFIEDLAK
jgi:hypothetical protein